MDANTAELIAGLGRRIEAINNRFGPFEGRSSREKSNSEHALHKRNVLVSNQLASTNTRRPHQGSASAILRSIVSENPGGLRSAIVKVLTQRNTKSENKTRPDGLRTTLKKQVTPANRATTDYENKSESENIRNKSTTPIVKIHEVTVQLAEVSLKPQRDRQSSIYL